jgi:hypothetical protein
MYWLPNPLFPFIWYRVGLPGQHPELEVETLVDGDRVASERREANPSRPTRGSSS